MVNKIKQVIALQLVMILILACIAPSSFADDTMVTLYYQNNGNGAFVGKGDTEQVKSGDTITLPDFVMTSWDSRVPVEQHDPSYFTYFILGDSTGKYYYLEGDSFQVTSSTSIGLVPSYNRFKLKYDANGATSGNIPACKVTPYGDIDKSLVVASNEGQLAKTGYEFVNWNTSPDGTGKDYTSGDAIYRDVPQSVTRLYAKWTPVMPTTFNITYNCLAERGTSSKSTEIVNDGENIAFPSITEARGWRFLGWYGKAPDGSDIEKSPGDLYSVHSNLSFEAVFVPASKRSVTYDINGASKGSAAIDNSVYYKGDKVVVLGNTGLVEKQHYNFGGWNTAADGTGTTYKEGQTFTLAENTRLYANWTWSVSYDADGAQGTLPIDATDYNDINKTAIVKNQGDLVKSGYEFAGWKAMRDGFEKTFQAGQSIQIYENLILKAVWVPVVQAIKHSVTYDINGANGGTAPIDANKYSSGAAVTILNNLSSLTKTGFQFAGWNTKTDGSGTQYIVGQAFSITENMRLYANWKANEVIIEKPVVVEKPIVTDKPIIIEKPQKEDTRANSKENISNPIKPPVIVNIPVDNVPLGKLNMSDHFAYMSGYPDKSFNPNGAITRAEVATILFRLLEDADKGKFIAKSSTFSDVNVKSWYSKAVIYLSEKRLMTGDTDGKFRPNAPISRAELATAISKFYNLESNSAVNVTDIKGHWAEKYIQSAFSKKWINGYEDQTFRPDMNMSRIDAASMINNALERKILKSNIPENKITHYTDILDSYWGYEAIVEATNSHLYKKEADKTEIWTSVTTYNSYSGK